MNTDRPLTSEPVPRVARSGSTFVLRRILIKSVVISLTVLVCLIMLEVGLRIINRYPMENGQGYFAPGGISYVLKTNITKTVVWPTMSFTVHTSDLGFRSPQPGAQPDAQDIGEKPYYVVLGASDAFGNGLDYRNSFVGIFAKKMNRNHNTEVINMAISGHHLLEQSALFKQFASSATHAPKAVLIIFNPLFVGGYDDIHTNVIVRRGDLFEDKKWRIALTRKVLANSSTTYCFTRDSVRKLQQKIFGRKDFALPFYVERFSSKHRIHDPEKTEDFLNQLKDLTQYIRSLNATPICVYCPPAGEFLLNDLVTKGQLESGVIDTKFFADLVQKHCEMDGIEFLNLEPPAQERYDKGEKLNFDGDGHYNVPTSLLVGNYLYDALRPDRKKN